jgi:hypothetical protein
VQAAQKKRIMNQAGLGKKEKPYLQNNQSKERLDMWLPSKHEGLCSNPLLKKNKKH